MRRTESAPAKTNLLGDLTSFIGRANEQAGVLALFESGARLVTVTGLGGIGKTRFALRLAATEAEPLSSHGGGGAWFCDLSEAHTALGVNAAVAAVLGVTLSSSEESTTVARAIARRKRILLVLDNFEQAVSCAAETLAQWMKEAPLARFLVTSRVALGIAGEQQWPLVPLATPGEEEQRPEVLAESEAVQLFIKRATQVRPNLALSPEALRSIATIVRRLDGIPLAIELAAARTAVLSPSALLQRLSQPLEVLQRSSDAGKHGSMRSAIADSVRQLGDYEQRCLAALSVFRSGFTLSAAESVLPQGGSPLAALETLVAHSLVRAEEARSRRTAEAEPAAQGELRFTLFEAIREFARGMLESEQAQAELRARHADYYRNAVQTWALESPSHRAAGLARMEQELENLLLAHATLKADASSAARSKAALLALQLTPLLSRRGLFRLLKELLDEAVESARQQPESALQLAEALVARGQASRDLGLPQEARKDLEQAVELAQREHAPRVEAQALLRLGEMIETAGATAEARSYFARALELDADSPSAQFRAEVGRRIAHALRREGDLEQAERRIFEAQVLYRAAGDDEGLGLCLYEAAVVAMFRQRYDEALARFDEALPLVRAHGARLAEGALLSGLGIYQQERGELPRALELHQQAVELFRELGHRHREASALYYLGGCYLERAQWSDAARIFEQSLRLLQSVSAPRYVALVQGAQAVLMAVLGDFAAAEAHLQQAAQALEACSSEGTLLATIALHRLNLQGRKNPAEARERKAEAQALALGHAVDDTRFALRLLELSARTEPAPGDTPDALLVRANGSAFRLPGSNADVDLSRRAPLRRILVALAQRRLDAPGEGLDVEEILAAGWPGERVSDRAGNNRVHVALTTLRNLGLRGVLVSSPGGYSLRAAEKVVLESAPTAD